MQVANGLILLDKPAGLTCARIIDRVKPLLPPGTKLGHAGTLDSFATGLLILLAGSATRQCESIMGLPKSYQATIRLGATSETDDSQSTPRPTQMVGPPPTIQQIEIALAPMIGNVLQQPPTYSALKIRGKRASDRARAGGNVELAPRPVRIDAITVTRYQWPDVEVNIECGRGTYVRAIGRDLGKALGCGGYLVELRRTRIGPFNVAHAQSLDALMSKQVEVRLTSAF